MSNLTQAAHQWAVEALSGGPLPAQVDIDELTSEELPDDAVSAALACGVAIENLVRSTQPAIDVAVVIPLPCDEFELPTSTPQLTDLIDTVWPYGPGQRVPGIYLVPSWIWGSLEEGEEYRRSIQDPAVPKGFVAYYRAWRTLEDMNNGWEYLRAIYVRTATSDLIEG